MVYHACGKEYPWLNIVERDIAGDLADGIADRKDRVDLIELIALEMKLLFHPRDIGIVEVRSIQIVEKVHETAEG